MLNQTFLESVNARSRSGETGRVILHAPHCSGYVDLCEGVVVHASFRDSVGILAFFNLMKEEVLAVEWRETRSPEVVSLNHRLDELMWRLAALPGEQALQEEAGMPLLPAAASVLAEAEGDAEFMPTADMTGGAETVEEPSRIDYSRHRLVLQTTNPELRKLTFTLEQGNHLFGKSRDCDCLVIHPTISKYECTLTIYEDHVQVVDRGSTIGVFCNGTKLKEFFLNPGDHLVLGGVGFTVETLPIQEGLLREVPQHGGLPPAGESTGGMVKEVITGPIKLNHILPRTPIKNTASLLGKLFRQG